jgi:hypothetical protein
MKSIRSFDGTTGFGQVLTDELSRTRAVRSQMLLGIASIGGTLRNDGAKSRKRSLVNSVLMTAMGPFICRSTNATGMFRSTAFLLDDIKGAIAAVGESNVFIVALD